MKLTHFSSLVRPGGGPPGYLFNLKQGLEKSSVDTIRVFGLSYNDDRTFTGGSAPVSRNSLKYWALRAIPRSISKHYYSFKTRQVWKRAFSCPASLDLTGQSELIVFHSSLLASQALHAGALSPSSRFLVMPHAPTDMATEIVANLAGARGFSPSQLTSLRNDLAKLEIQVYESAMGLVAPCSEALSGYFDYDGGKQAAFRALRLYDIPSGIAALEPTKNREQVLHEWGLPTDKQLVGFFGRYAGHKGYDLFCDAAQIAQANGREDVFFLSAGAGSIEPPEHLENFRNLGWQSAELPNLLASVDVVVIPNRVTYFDLLVLEALSLGKPVITTRTGGNILFEDQEGICLLSHCSADAICEALSDICSSPEKMSSMAQANLNLFASEYNLDAFIQRHVDLYERLCRDLDSPNA